MVKKLTVQKVMYISCNPNGLCWNFFLDLYKMGRAAILLVIIKKQP